MAEKMIRDWSKDNNPLSFMEHRKFMSDFLRLDNMLNIEQLADSIQTKNLSQKLQHSINTYIIRFSETCLGDYLFSPVPRVYSSIRKVEELIKLLKIPIPAGDKVLLTQQITNYIELLYYELNVSIYPLLDAACYHKNTKSHDILLALIPNCASALGEKEEKLKSMIPNIDELILYLQKLLPAHRFSNMVILNQNTGHEIEDYKLYCYKLIGNNEVQDCLELQPFWKNTHESLHQNCRLCYRNIHRW